MQLIFRNWKLQQNPHFHTNKLKLKEFTAEHQKDCQTLHVTINTISDDYHRLVQILNLNGNKTINYTGTPGGMGAPGLGG